MNNLLFLGRMARREFRRGRRKFAFFLFCIAIGVSALVAVKGFNANMQLALLREARTLIAADLKLTLRSPAAPEQEAVLRRLEDQGIQVSAITETVTMAVSPATGHSTLAEVKAISSGYPFYGSLVVEPPAQLTDSAALVSADLLDQLGLGVGDSVKVGTALYEIAGVIVQEPDRITAGLGVAPRIMLTGPGLERAGLIQFGSLATYGYLFRLADDQQVEAVRAELRSAFARQRPRLTDFRDAQPQIRRILDRMTSFLSLLSMVALLVGGLGVANATRVFIHEKLDSIAIMKSLGATTLRVTSVYFVQVLLLALAGSLIGLGLGYGLQLMLPGLVGSLLNLKLLITLDPQVALQGLAVGMATAVLFALLPLTAIGSVKPIAILRRDMAQQRPAPSLGSRVLHALLVGAIGLGFGSMSAWVSGSTVWGFTFMAGLAGAVLILWGVSEGTVRAVRRIRLPPGWVSFRQGLGNLHRPGSQTSAIVTAIGVGLAMVLAILLVQRSLLNEVEAVAPRGAPNMIFTGIQHEEAEAFYTMLSQAPGVLSAPEPAAQVRGRIAQIDGRVPEQRDLTPEGARLLSRISLTQGRFQPQGTQLTAGRWWTPEDHASRALIAVEQEEAEQLGLRVGSTVAMEIRSGHRLQAEVFAIFTEADVRGVGTGGDFIVSPGSLDMISPTYLGQARVRPESAGEVQRALVARFPTVTVINITQILANVRPVLERISLVIRSVAGFSMAAGLLILASSIAATRFRRTRESALYRTLGATRRQVWQIFAVEYAALGLVAGSLGAGFSVLAARTVMVEILDLRFRWDPVPVATAVVVTMGLAVLVGVVSTLSMVTTKPLQVLREE